MRSLGMTTSASHSLPLSQRQRSAAEGARRVALQRQGSLFSIPSVHNCMLHDVCTLFCPPAPHRFEWELLLATVEPL